MFQLVQDHHSIQDIILEVCQCIWPWVFTPETRFQSKAYKTNYATEFDMCIFMDSRKLFHLYRSLFNNTANI